MKKYISLSLFGSILWMSLFIGAGYFFGNIPAVKSQFHYVIIAVIAVSFLPGVIALARTRFKTN